MVTFIYSETSSTFKFSSKTDIITLPMAIQKMAPDDVETIKQFCITVREIYIQKVIQFTTESVGKKMCPIQLRHLSISEAIALYQKKLTPEVFNPLYAQFQSVSQLPKHRKNQVLGKPRTRSFTALDRIEEI